MTGPRRIDIWVKTWGVHWHLAALFFYVNKITNESLQAKNHTNPKKFPQISFFLLPNDSSHDFMTHNKNFAIEV